MARNARAEQLREYGRSVLEGARSEQVLRMARQVNAVSYTSAREYAGRSLFELLQNGYDAHPEDRRDGRVHVLLNEAEGEWGTLYVANGGTPFTWRNVERICELAQSSKEVGEGIGNKGVGFRSILLISEAPEIYSADPDSPLGPELDGYCFRFAQRADVEEFLAGEDNAHEVAAKYPPLQAPLPLDDVPATCRQLAAQGYVTIVRLPLLSEAARAEVRLRMRELAEAKVPVMLFLDRLAGLTLERRAAGGEAGELDDGHETLELHELTRSEERFAVAQDGAGHGFPVSCATVDLGTSGTFLVARGTVEKERLNSTLAEAVGSGLLDDTWQEWKRSAVVEVALSLPALRRPLRGQIYTFLPMGEDQAAPFPGHVNAPFFTKFDRTGFPPDNPLNVLLLDAVAETCLAAAAVLRTVPELSMRQLAVDLVSWESEKGSAGRLRTAALRVHGSELADVPLVPVLAADGAPPEAGWAPPRGAVLWSDLDLTVLTAHRAHEAGIVVADPEIGGGRLKRLATLCKALACPWEPGPEILAEYVERIVGGLPIPRPGESPEQWSALYEDLAALFEDDGHVLHGRQLLLAEDCTLRYTNRPLGRAGAGTSTRTQGKPSGQGVRREAFFQPVRTEANPTEAPSVPALLGKRLFSLHPGLVWKDRGERTRGRSARAFLEQEGLVRPYDTRGLLDHVRQALSASTDLRLRLQTLRFVFRLWQPQRSLGGTEISSLGLYVPSADGRLIRASDAVFGRGWGRASVGEDLAAVVAAGQDVSKSLKAIAGRLLAAPDEFAKRGETEEWRAFLLEAGVADGLVPVTSSDALSWVEQGRELSTRQLVRMAKVSAEVQEQWEPYVHWPGVYYPRTPYRGTPAWRLPGQDIVGRLGQEARLAYARLVLHGLASWEDARFASVWTSAGSQSSPDRERVPTPLGAFVREQPWLPVRGRDRAVRFVRPADAWHCPPGLEEEPSYAPTVDHRLRHLLERGKAGDRLREMRLPTWDDPRDSDRLIAALGRLAAEGALGAEDRPAAQRANERAWKHLVRRPGPALPKGASLLAESGDRLISVPLSALDGRESDGDGDAGTVLYVSGERDSLTALLIRGMARPLLTLPGVSAKAAELLAADHPTTVRHTDDLMFTVTVDGTRVKPASMGEALAQQLPWLTLAVGVLCDHLARGPRASEVELSELMSLVRSVRLHRYRSWDIELDGRPVTLPGRLGGVLPLPDPKHPLVLAPAGEPGWPETTRIVVAVAELLGRREFGDRLRLAAHQLAARHADLRDPGQEELADALEVTVHQVEETSFRIDGAIGVVLERCRPFLAHLLGTETANSLFLPPPGDTREFQTHLEEYAAELPVPVSEFIARARAARGTDELRRDLGIGFAALNDTLRAMSPPLEPVSHAAEHEEALRTYLDLRRKELVNRLRWAVLEDFDARRPVPDWPSVRALDWITAPEAWEYTVDTADTGSLEAYVEERLALRLGRPVPLPRSGERLPAPDQVRGANLRTITGLAAELAVLVRAAGHPLPAALTAAEPAEEVTARLEAVGALDFRHLSPTDVVGWLAALGQWPDGMAVATDPERHGLSGADLDRVRNAAEHERRERERKRRSISVGGRDFDVHSGDFTALTRELDRVLQSGSAPGITAAGPLRFTDPRPQTGRTPAAGRTRGWRYGGGTDSGLTTAQREAIGYVGEWYAYQWLCARYPDRMDETCWVSGNRRKAFPGPSGDDGLGFDFRVGSGNRPYLYEVKATGGEGGRFELGESEVRAARQHAGNDRWRLLVVTHALTPHKMAIQMLPNPYGKRGRGRYREEGGALRFSYLL
ncbi:sacsin N-terminal ATP-binding-like domain-containing protein [Streptomyces sp. NPDC017202]|uniref:sacsin N-terminal ATP-binding-like domain-containing protein n=1 Tax=Streptomyces sp. NPDC017202 TaxID=3364981 RepID=UPI0037B92442